MTKCMRAYLLALPLLAFPSTANAFDFDFGKCRVDAGINPQLNVTTQNGQWGFNGCNGCGGLHAGPWYLYWPLEAHFQTPAPIIYPYWPSSMTTGAACYQPPPPAQFYLPPPKPAPEPAPKPQPTSFQPVGYYYWEVPSYWYGR